MLDQLLKHELLEIREHGKIPVVADGTFQSRIALMWNHGDYRKSLGETEAGITRRRAGSVRDAEPPGG